MPPTTVFHSSQTADLPQASSHVRAHTGRRRLNHVAAWMMASVLMMLGLLSSASPTASADEVVGQVTAWGQNRNGQSDVPASLGGKSFTAIAAGGYHNLALTSDGRIATWGDNQQGQTDVPASLGDKTVTAIAAGGYHSLALTSDGHITAWGSVTDGQARVPASLSDKFVTAIAAGFFGSLALTSNGQVIAWGYSERGQTDVPASLDGEIVTAIAAGSLFNLALTSDGQIVGWGDNFQGQTDVPASLAGEIVTTIAAGEFHSLALTSDGHVSAWGGNEYGQTDIPPSLAGKTVTAIDGGRDHSLALTADGQITAWGGNTHGEVDVPSSLAGRTVTEIAAGPHHSLAIAPYSPAPVVSSSPVSVSALVGDSVSFSAAAAGTPQPTVQWQRANPGEPFVDVIGATNTTYTLYPVTTAEEGAAFRAVFANATGSVASRSATVTINDSPTALDQTLTTPSGQTLDIFLTAADPDPQLGAMEFYVINRPTHGTLVGTYREWTYAPDEGYIGSDSFTFRVSDGSTSSALATVTIQVTAPSCVRPSPRREFTVNADRSLAGSIRSRKIRTRRAGQLLVAFVSSNGPTKSAQSVTEVTGGGLTWTLVERNNETTGTSEIWQAYAEHKLPSARVTATFAETGYSATMTIAGFTNAGKVTGAAGHLSGQTRDSTPRVSFIAHNSRSKFWAVGRVIGSRYHPRAPRGQVIVHHRTDKSRPAGFWIQRVRATTTGGQPVNISSTATTNYTWSYTAVEIRGQCRR